jgi:hypothetical protein
MRHANNGLLARSNPETKPARETHGFSVNLTLELTQRKADKADPFALANIQPVPQKTCVLRERRQFLGQEKPPNAPHQLQIVSQLTAT